MGAKATGQVLSIITVVIAAVCSMGIALQLTVHARYKLLSKEAETSAVQWAQQFELGGGGTLYGTEGQQRLEKKLRQVNASSNVFSFVMADKTGKIIFDSWADRADENKGEAPTASPVAPGQARSIITELRHGDSISLPHFFSEVYVPIISQGKFLGSVTVFSDETARLALYKRSFGFLTAGLLIVMALGSALAGSMIARKIVQHRRAENQVEFLAHHDSLTGVMNRASFTEQMDQTVLQLNPERQSDDSTALMWIDLDEFKDINDNFGHQIGDGLLKYVGDRLRESVDEDELIARMGGDEFAIFCTRPRSRAELDTLAEALCAKLNTVVCIDDQYVRSGACIGIAPYPDAGETVAELVQSADLAMYSAKANGRHGYRFYQPQMHEEMRARREIGQALARAVGNSELEVYYQPQVNLDTDDVDAFEALIRWNHPERGLVSPVEFIPIAEETGLINEIGEWILREACMEAARWPGGERIAVNLSPAQFKDNEILGVVRRALADSGLQPARLELEITESLLFHDPEHALGTLSALKALGVKLAMDDFGTGYSSLAHLWRFPFDKIKIDQSFVKNVNEDPKVAKIITSIIDLGRALDISITAEGVEIASQAQFLRDRSCDLVQGFFYGRPSPDAQSVGRAAAAAGAATEPNNAADQLLDILKDLESTDKLTPEAGGRILQELVKLAKHTNAAASPAPEPAQAAENRAAGAKA